LIFFLIRWLYQAPRTNTATAKARLRLIYRTFSFSPALFARSEDQLLRGIFLQILK
jgi:hypothetical protein